jgi:hypothetical protein
MTGLKEYKGAAVTATLSAGLDSSSISFSISPTTGWPTGGVGPFTVIIDPGGVEEQLYCSALSAGVLTVTTRGYNGTAAVAHLQGVSVVHAPTSVDFTEANAHVMAVSGVHSGLAPLASPTFTGTVTIPTGAQVATPNITGAVTAPAVADSADGYGYVGTPQVSTAVNLTVALSHMGKDIYVTATGKTITIDSNANLALQIGSGFTVTNDTGVTTSIAITTDTLVLANSASTGTRTLAPYGVAVFKKVTATKWICSGNGLT